MERGTKYVYFENSEIERFNEELMEQLKEVEYLNVNYVELEAVDGRCLGIVAGLKTFFGAHNELTRIDANAFSHNKKLEVQSDRKSSSRSIRWAERTVCARLVIKQAEEH